MLIVSCGPTPCTWSELNFKLRVDSGEQRIHFSRLNNPSGLSEWFADDVNIKKDVFTFFGMVPRNRPGSTQKREEFVKFAGWSMKRKAPRLSRCASRLIR